jgi:hypothetical protein
MNKITPFLWFDDNAEDAAEFYLSVFPEAKKVGELRSSGVGALARRKDRDHHHRTYWPANDVPQRWPRAGAHAGFLVLRGRARTRPRSTATRTSCLRVAIPWPAAG